MSRIAYVTNAPPQAGMGKPARAIHGVFAATGRPPDLYYLDGARRELWRNNARAATLRALPGPLNVKPLNWWRLARRLPTAGYDLWHFTNQTLSFIPRLPYVLTVYDLIELLDPQERFGKLVARFLYRGIPAAAHVICISAYTKQTVIDAYRVPEERITVIPLGVARTFTALPGARASVAYHEFLRQQRLPPNARILLYVGSDHPRKNLATLAAALAQVRTRVPDAVLLKVGDPGLPEGRERFLAELDRYKLRSSVRFIGNVGDEELRLFYSLADVLVFPSTFEGFGIPPLEALACGVPVVCAKATSLPEVVGDAGLLCDPHSPSAFADAIVAVLTRPNLAADLREKGLQRVPAFYWEGIAEKTFGVYRRVLGGASS